MPQRHLDRLTSVDAGFLIEEERGDAHMHIGALVVSHGPAPDIASFRRHIADRLHLVPRYRQRVVDAPFGTGRPLWAEDPQFNLQYHVRHTALPAPGNDEQLHGLVGRIHGQRLDRRRPLWEMWLVEGLQGGRWALINKTHHALVDGVGGVDVLTALVDLTEEVRHVEAPPWRPHRRPSTWTLLQRAAESTAGRAASAAGLAGRLARDPRRVLRSAAAPAQGLTELLWQVISDPAPTTPLNVRVGPHRRYATTALPLADFKVVKDGLGGTVNDAVLAAVAGALGEFLRSRGVVPERDLVACVPMSLRTGDQAGSAGNQISIMTAALPVGVRDPAERFHRVHASMTRLKRSNQAVGAQALTTMEDFAPPTVLAEASRLNFSARVYNLLVTNVPGPQFPFYLLGRRVEAVFPIAFLSPTHALAVAAISYEGSVNVGLLGDFDAMPEVDRLAEGLHRALAELVAAARVRQAA